MELFFHKLQVFVFIAGIIELLRQLRPILHVINFGFSFSHFVVVFDSETQPFFLFFEQIDLGVFYFLALECLLRSYLPIAFPLLVIVLDQILKCEFFVGFVVGGTVHQPEIVGPAVSLPLEENGRQGVHRLLLLFHLAVDLPILLDLAVV